MEQENEKSHKAKDAFKYIFYTLGIAGSLWIGYQQHQINHRLDVRDAKQFRGIIDASKQNEQAFLSERRQVEKILSHCKLKSCELPPELSVLNSEHKIISISEILMKEQ